MSYAKNEVIEPTQDPGLPESVPDASAADFQPKAAPTDVGDDNSAPVATDDTIDKPISQTSDDVEDKAKTDSDRADETVRPSNDRGSKHTVPQLRAEELDHIADVAIETLRGVLAYFGAENVAIDEYEGEDGELILDIVDADLAVLIGRYGKTLDALQFLVAAMVNQKIDIRYPIVIDIEGYRNRRRQKLESTAKSAAARCIHDKAPVRLRPMTPHDRRIIHIILRNENRVFTESEGEEPNRYVLVKPC